MSEQLIIMITVLGMIGTFVLVIRLAIAQRRREVERLQRAGFFEVTDPDPSLVDCLADVMKAGTKRAAVGTIFRRAAGFYELYTFLNSGADSSGMTFAARMPGLALPRIRLMRKVALGGRLGRWLNELAAQIGGMGLAAVDLRRWPEIAERYLVFSADPDACAQLIVEHWREPLREAPDGFALSAAGGVAAFGFQQPMSRGQRPSVPAIPGMPSTVERQFTESVRVIEKFIEALRNTAAYSR